ncbi:pantetheine-phosphate adenylyltransferase [Acetanaerobacterium sp. MSJ-12]|uniref:Phosphopantetheine adenylyltransferase n=1 Tax=Bittarella massiliensis (ex Durand et al. 2017) TaxID=1720313 RepID=A0AAP1LLB2_9FIRM|nr:MULTISPECIES: pantetheine-phosphate adenylyltransferase [Eubacteriales]ERI99834.1 pantetheine-phosphate adenylyltransferase [Clostridium sp. ATCC 29733]MBC2872321.1 pantetheine-phosphate adenylyltransferase [Bittarella massiliensis (ex Durand et al. 2017)]MBU5420577.1 pantetheine-phosphate adenylyltransferase [Acetanaerobacterium sp. MSJ-12]MCQ4949731.1 pantetheine-phosphate adenylyltransferase [Bittarella massiliensis (ex Durand et al. 2017)]MZL69256.1 pantetheine-phosphate adenylyltransfe
MRTALCPGSFDPITKGHLDIILRASRLFDRVVVLVSVNPDKRTAFSVEERVELIRAVTGDLANVEVDAYQGLLVDYARQVGATASIRGLRAVSDFEYEFQMALANKKLDPQLETIFLNTNSKYMYLSSSLVKQIAAFGGDIDDFVPQAIIEPIKQRLSKGVSK